MSWSLKECFLSGIVASHILSCTFPDKKDTDVQEAQRDITNVIHAAQADVDRRVHEGIAESNEKIVQLQKNMDLLEGKLNKMNGLQLEMIDSFINWNTHKNIQPVKKQKHRKH